MKKKKRITTAKNNKKISNKIPNVNKAIEEAIRATHQLDYDGNFKHFEFSVKYDGQTFIEFIHADEGIDSVEAFKNWEKQGERIELAVKNIKKYIKEAIENQEVAQIIII